MTLVCDLCGEAIKNPDRDAMRLGFDRMVIGGEAVKHAHLGCYRLTRALLELGLAPGGHR